MHAQAEGERDTPSPSAATAAPQAHPGVDVAAALRPPYATPSAKTDAFAAALAALTDARVTGAWHVARLMPAHACADVAAHLLALSPGEAAVGLQWSLCAAFLRDFPRSEDDEAEGPPGFIPPHVLAEAELKQARPAKMDDHFAFSAFLTRISRNFRLRRRMAQR